MEIPYFIRGDTVDIVLTLYSGDKSDNVFFDLTNKTVFFTMKKSLDDDDTDSVLQAMTSNHVDPINGKTIISLSSLQTNIAGTFYCDVQIVDHDFNAMSVKPFKMYVYKDVTRRTS